MSGADPLLLLCAATLDIMTNQSVNVDADLLRECGLRLVKHLDLLQVAKLLERSAANKELNDRKRLTTSYANLASSR